MADTAATSRRQLKADKPTLIGWGLSIVMLLGALTFGVSKLRQHLTVRQMLSPSNVLSAMRGSDLFDPRLAYFKRGSPDLAAVALTIDDGPHPESMVKILDTLKVHHIHATFFVVGEKVAQHPELIKRMMLDGDEVGNHSMTHPRFDTLDQAGLTKEVVGCQQAVQAITGQKMTLLRPPGVRLTPAILQAVKALGYVTVGENIGAKDFIVEGDYSWYPNNPEFPKRVAQVRNDVVKQLKNGAIIDLHDMPATAVALDGLITDIEAKGYRIETASELLAGVHKP